MKLSKNLLKAMAIGVTMGAAVSSCNMFDSATDLEKAKCSLTCDDQCQESNHGRENGGDYCPACGLG